MKKFFYSGILLLSLLLYSSSAFSCAECLGYSYGQNHLYTLKAPKGWRMVNQVAESPGFHPLLYRKGEKADDAHPYMYSYVTQLSKEMTSIQDLIRFSKDKFRTDKPKLIKDLKIKHIKSIKQGEKTIEIYQWSYGNRKEAVAYVKEAYAIVVFILTTPNAKEYKKTYPAFRDLLESYNFISSDVMYRSVTPELFKEVEALYDEQMKDHEARMFAKKLSAKYLKKLAQLYLSCHNKIQKADDFELLFTINHNGFPLVIYWTPSEIADCMYKSKNGLTKFLFPALPKPYQYFHWHHRFLSPQ